MKKERGKEKEQSPCLLEHWKVFKKKQSLVETLLHPLKNLFSFSQGQLDIRGSFGTSTLSENSSKKRPFISSNYDCPVNTRPICNLQRCSSPTSQPLMTLCII
ncbi:hypothetical protein M8J75_012686 [Diaphorina citri]|nr:hypothetical protein M8J75_012686 [Diaphorina citri]